MKEANLSRLLDIQFQTTSEIDKTMDLGKRSVVARVYVGEEGMDKEDFFRAVRLLCIIL